MPRRARISFAESALSDLHAIQKWYAEQLVPKAEGSLSVRQIMRKRERHVFIK